MLFLPENIPRKPSKNHQTPPVLWMLFVSDQALRGDTLYGGPNVEWCPRVFLHATRQLGSHRAEQQRLGWSCLDAFFSSVFAKWSYGLCLWVFVVFWGVWLLGRFLRCFDRWERMLEFGLWVCFCLLQFFLRRSLFYFAKFSMVLFLEVLEVCSGFFKCLGCLCTWSLWFVGLEKMLFLW